MKTASAAVLLLVLTLAGCGTESDPPSETKPTTEPTATSTTSAAPRGTTIEIEFVNGEVVPLNDKVDVKIGVPINLHVVSDVEEEIHVHSDPEHTYAVAPGDDKTFTFTVDTPGQVAVEAHHLDVTIVELVARP